MTLIYWVTFGLVVIYLMLLVRREVDRRARVRRMKERRLRRRMMDARTPQRWTP